MSRLAPIAAFVWTATVAFGQTGPEYTGTLLGWAGGSGVMVMHSDRLGPPPAALSGTDDVVGEVEEDGSFHFVLPETMPEDRLVPIIKGIGSCPTLEARPEGAMFFPLDVVIYSEGRLVGMLFPVSPSATTGPNPPGYSVLMGYSADGFGLNGSCPDEPRRVEELFEIDAEPGWHTIVQYFEVHPSRDGWRLDRWRAAELPDDVVWTVLGPPF